MSDGPTDMSDARTGEGDVRTGGGGVRPGRLKVYLGAAPGVGKTYRMLDEGPGAAARGADVVVGFVECHGAARRPRCSTAWRSCPAPPRDYRGAEFNEMDLDAVLARRPEVALVDELRAHQRARRPQRRSAGRTSRSCSPPGSTSSPPSTSSTWSRSTTSSRRSPACRSARRCPTRSCAAPTRSSWSTCPPRRCAAAWRTATSTRRRRSTRPSPTTSGVGNLTALRELALLWVADRVDEALQKYRAEHGIGGVWETRERVVVALTGGPEGDTLIRRAARIADRSAGGDLLAVHVARSDGLAAGASHAVAGPAAAAGREPRRQLPLGRRRRRRPTALLDFARARERHPARPRHQPPRPAGALPDRARHRRDGDRALRRHRRPHGHPRAGRDAAACCPSRRRTLPHRTADRRARSPACVLPVLLTASSTSCAAQLNLTSEALLFLLTVVGVACIGGVASAVIASVTASLLLNYWFIPPIGEFTMDDPNNAAGARGLRGRRRHRGRRRGPLAAAVPARGARHRRGRDACPPWPAASCAAATTIPALLERTRETFGMDSAELVDRADRARATAVHAPCPPGPGAFLVLRGRTLPVLRTAGAGRLRRARRRRRRTGPAGRGRRRGRAGQGRRPDAYRAAAGRQPRPAHPARRRLGGRQPRCAAGTCEFSAEDREELLATADESMAKLNRLVENLLDLSRLQAGALTLNLRRHHAGGSAADGPGARRTPPEVAARTWSRSRPCWPTRRCWNG